MQVVWFAFAFCVLIWCSCCRVVEFILAHNPVRNIKDARGAAGGSASLGVTAEAPRSKVSTSWARSSESCCSSFSSILCNLHSMSSMPCRASRTSCRRDSKSMSENSSPFPIGQLAHAPVCISPNFIPSTRIRNILQHNVAIVLTLCCNFVAIVLHFLLLTCLCISVAIVLQFC